MVNAEIVVVGAGVIGTGVAWNLAALGAKGIHVIEREELIGRGSTGRSAAGVRQQFSTPINVAICKRSIELFGSFPQVHDQEIEFRQVGYLFLLCGRELVSRFQTSFALWKEHGLPVEWLSGEEVARRYPFLRTDDVLGASFCPTDGSVDPSALNYGYYRSSVRAGVSYHFNREVTAIRRLPGGIFEVVTPAETFQTPILVDCAGPYFQDVARLAGVNMPTEPIRRHCFLTDTIEEGRLRNIPMIVDMSTGLHFRGESDGFLMGLAKHDEPPGYSLDVDWDQMEVTFGAFASRVPAFDVGLRKGWAGLYCVSRDHQAIIGPVPEFEGFYVLGGFSGHGIMQCAATTEGLARRILHGAYGPLDLTPLEVTRFDQPGFECEANVI